jgi:hypothetical protein
MRLGRKEVLLKGTLWHQPICPSYPYIFYLDVCSLGLAFRNIECVDKVSGGSN